MPGLKFEERVLEVDKESKPQPAQDPLAGKWLQCPYCGWVYLPEEGCFCLRLVGWESASRPEPNDEEKRS
jgi:hypothetical protein